MANFVGIVTQQDVKTGLTLRARVTSPKGRFTAYQDFRCMVKKAGLTDEQSVTTDLNTVSNSLLAFGVTGITSNVTGAMPSVGENETLIKYEVTGDNISDYFNSDGIVSKRPPYGSNSVIGTLKITVTKNAAVAIRDITISVEPYTAEELIESVLDEITWNNIRGLNGIETSDPATNGMFNVINPLNLMTKVSTNLIAEPVEITWSIEEDVLSSTLGGALKRVDLVTGTITRPTYTDVYEAKNTTLSGSFVNIVTSKVENAYGRKYMQIGGLKLKATIAITDAINGGQLVDSIMFSLKTLSAALTNSEVSAYLTDNISLFNIKDTKYNSVFSLSTINDKTEKTVFIDTTRANSSILEMFGENAMSAATASNDFTGSGIEVINIQWSAIDPTTADSTPVVIPFFGYSLEGKQIINGNSVLALDPAVAPVNTKLVLRAVISVNNYNGPISYITVFYRFALDNVTPQAE